MTEKQSGPWQLPVSWQWSTMGNVSEIVGGGTPSTSEPMNFAGPIPWITPADLSTHAGKTILGGARSISQHGFESCGARWVPKNTVLFSSRAPIGYVAIASRPVTTNQGFKSFVPSRGIDPDFVYYWLTSAKPMAEKLASGTTFPELSGAKAALIPFPVAPASEQTRIVEKLEELLFDLDAGVAELKAAQKKLDRYRQSLLKSAVEGVLTAAWREQRQAEQAQDGEALETGEQLLTRILAERHARWEAGQLAMFKKQGKSPPRDWRNRYPEPAELDTSGLPLLPHGWAWASLGQIAEIQGGVQKQPSRVPVSNTYPFLRVSNVARGRLKLEEIHHIELFPGEAERLVLQKGDLLVVEGNGSLTEIGRCAVWDGSIDNAVHQNHLIRARPLLMQSLFIDAWLNSSAGIEKMTGLAATTSGLYTLSVGKISRIPVPVPPLDEQLHAIELLGAAQEEATRLQLAIDASLKRGLAQRHNLLRSAFSGQLVAQDSNDEPAAVLLGRIHTERIAQAATRHKRGRKAREAA